MKEIIIAASGQGASSSCIGWVFKFERLVERVTCARHADENADDRDVERNGRSGEIRTPDPHNPIVVRYQAALRSDLGRVEYPYSKKNTSLLKKKAIKRVREQ